MQGFRGVNYWVARVSVLLTLGCASITSIVFADTATFSDAVSRQEDTSKPESEMQALRIVLPFNIPKQSDDDQLKVAKLKMFLKNSSAYDFVAGWPEANNGVAAAVDDTENTYPFVLTEAPVVEPVNAEETRCGSCQYF